ncbi:MAG TPA: HAMP domain-containing sensor histidine kinase [Spirochaetales bacterium]|nr:HAMP domain-containing sensor histidine kinase [Spirochaetales bacterium]HPM74030.1 HAMP domain-containing sensor histidine kinase [Spirochaetales bacterium]HQO66155.1 HAMP domain-containing sensor histidine kinase [Spirochaetales bacterium]
MHFAVCDFLLDLVQNSVEAGAANVGIDVVESGGSIEATVEDDGKGMDERELERAKDPFYTDGTKHARRKVGLGLPFLIQATEQAGGDFRISSRKGSGTRVSFGFPVDGVDTPPLGDLPGLFLSAMCFDGDYELVIRRRAPARGVDYEIRRSEILEAAGPLDDASALVAVREFLASHEAS